MGLGPPVCLGCKLIMAFDQDFKRWSCRRCGKKNTDRGTGHLLCLSAEDFAEVSRNSEPKDAVQQ